MIDCEELIRPSSRIVSRLVIGHDFEIPETQYILRAASLPRFISPACCARPSGHTHPTAYTREDNTFEALYTVLFDINWTWYLGVRLE